MPMTPFLNELQSYSSIEVTGVAEAISDAVEMIVHQHRMAALGDICHNDGQLFWASSFHKWN